jgi:hypothetical protein
MRAICFLISYCFALSVGFGQEIQISTPFDGAVFQRAGASNGSGGEATVTVQGTFNSAAYRQGSISLFAVLTPIQLSTGAVIPGGTQISFRLPINNAGLGGSFGGSRTVPAGWYNLQVVARSGGPQSLVEGIQGAQLAQSTIQKVGVGEVFVVSGQSNAQGLPNTDNDLNVAYPLPSSVGFDGVRVQARQVDPNAFVAWMNSRSESYLVNAFLMQPTVSVRDVQPSGGIAPVGNSLWYWAYYGQRIAEHYGVPVVMYNAAWFGTHVKVWSGSALQPTVPQPDRPGGGTYPVGAPFNLLGRTLNFFAATYGVRAVLWLQGETDVQALQEGTWGTRAVTSAANFTAELNTIINTSRSRFGNVPWVVGRNSIFTSDGNGSTRQGLVQQGQEGVVNTGNQIEFMSI